MEKKNLKMEKVKKKLNPIALNSSDAARYIGCSEAMLRKMRADGGGPEHRKIGTKYVYLRRDLKSWLDQQR